MTAKNKSTSSDSIVIRGVTYKRSFIKKSRNLLFFVVILFLAASPISPFFTILAAFFGFMVFKYNRILKSHNIPSISDQNSSKFQEAPSDTSVDSLFGSSNFQNSSTSSTSKNTSNKIKSSVLSFNVAGVTKNNDSKKDIQAIIKRAVKSIKENLEKDELYEGKSNKEIAEEGSYSSDYRIYELNFGTIDDVYLEPEPTNQYDPNAIKVISQEYGHIGYVPRSMTKKVKNQLSSDKHPVSCVITGGKYKYYDEDEEKILIESHTYGLNIEL